MASSDLMVGLEIGTSKICVVVGEGRPDGTIKILGVGQAPSRKDPDVEQLVAHLKRTVPASLVEHVAALVRKHPAVNELVVVSQTVRSWAVRSRISEVTSVVSDSSQLLVSPL